MVTKALLDTSILIDHLRQTAVDESVDTIYRKIKESGIKRFIAGITISELFGGKSTLNKAQERRVIKILSEQIVVMPTKEIFRKAGFLVRDDQIKDLVDALVAVTSLVKNLPLATLNKRHFQNIKGIKLM